MSAPIRVNFEITEACNLACMHCYHYASEAATGTRPLKDPKRWDLDHFERLLDTFLAQGVRVITFTGGEPFLRKDILLPLCERAKSAGVRVLINTNGVPVTDSDAERLAAIGVDGFLVSLMSSNSQLNNLLSQAPSHKRTMAGIEKLVRHGHQVTVNMVCTKINFRDLRSTATEMANLGVTGFCASPMLPTHDKPAHLSIHLSRDEAEQVMDDLLWARENLPIEVKTLDALVYCAFNDEKRRKLLPILNERYCCAGTSDCAVSADGSLRACVMSDESGGNVLTDGWESSWSGLAHWGSTDMLPPECLSCALVDQCGGGCRTAAKAMTGSLTGRDPYMTGPISAGTPAAEIAEDNRDRPATDPLGRDELIHAATDLVVRAEPFGASVFAGAKALFLGEDGAQFLTDVLDKLPVTISMLAQSAHYPIDDIEYFVQVLVDDGFLKRPPNPDER